MVYFTHFKSSEMSFALQQVACFSSHPQGMKRPCWAGLWVTLAALPGANPSTPLSVLSPQEWPQSHGYTGMTHEDTLSNAVTKRHLLSTDAHAQDADQRLVPIRYSQVGDECPRVSPIRADC